MRTGGFDRLSHQFFFRTGCYACHQDICFTEATGGSGRQRRRRRASGSEPVPTRAHLCVRVGRRLVTRLRSRRGTLAAARGLAAPS